MFNTAPPTPAPSPIPSIWAKPRLLQIWYAIAGMMDTFYALALLNPEKLKNIQTFFSFKVWIWIYLPRANFLKLTQPPHSKLANQSIALCSFHPWPQTAPLVSHVRHQNSFLGQAQAEASPVSHSHVLLSNSLEESCVITCSLSPLH